MNMAVGAYDPATQKALVAAGLNEKCQVYEMQMTRARRKSEANGSAGGGKGDVNNATMLTFNVNALKSVQTDYK